MAKQMLNIQTFDKGLNSYLDPRDIKATELSKAKNVMFSRNGMIKTIGRGVETGPTLDGGMHRDTHGYGLFTFESSYNKGTGVPGSFEFNPDVQFGTFEFSEMFNLTPTDNTENYETGSYWYMYSDGQGHIRVFIDEGDEHSFDIFDTTDEDHVREESCKAVFHLADEAIRISNANLNLNLRTKNTWFGVIKRENLFSGATTSTDYNFNGWVKLDNDIRKPLALGLKTHGDLASSNISDGNGFYIKVFALANAGSLDFTEDLDGSDNLKYDIAATFIYDGIQESLPFVELEKEILGSDASGVSDNSAIDSATDDALSIQVMVNTGFNPRVTGGRIYYKKAGSNDSFVLLCDIDFEKGIRASLDNAYTTGTAWDGTAGVGAEMISNSVILTTKNIDTYSTLTEWGERETRVSIGCNGDNYPNSISEGYKTSAIVNRRAFIANCKLYHKELSYGIPSGDSVRERDRIYYSGMCTKNGVYMEAAFDCFPRSNYIDVVKGDADEYTTLIGYADRLLAFKTNTLYILNVAGSPTEWFLESQHQSMGIKRPCQVIKTEDGVMWANSNGAYVYTGGEVRTTTAEDLSFGADIKNLSINRVNSDKWISDDTNMAVFYIYKKRQFGVLATTKDINYDAVGYIYDFTSNTWSSFGKNTIFTNLVTDYNQGGVSNFIINRDGDISWARNVWSDGATELIVNGDFTDTSSEIAGGINNSQAGDSDVVNYGFSTTHPEEVGIGTSLLSNYPQSGDRMLVATLNDAVDTTNWECSITHTIPVFLKPVNTYVISLADIGGSKAHIDSLQNFDSWQPFNALDATLTVKLQQADGGGSPHMIAETSVPERRDLQVGGRSLMIPSITGPEIIDGSPDEGELYQLTFVFSYTDNDIDVDYNGTTRIRFRFDDLSVSKTGIDNKQSRMYRFLNRNFLQEANAEDNFNIDKNTLEIITKDMDFGQPGLKKRIYAVYITYKSLKAQTTPVSYALDGVSSDDDESNVFTNLTGNMVDTTNTTTDTAEWKVGKFYPSSPLTCQSIRFRITNPTNNGALEINDIAVEHRITSRKVV